MIGVLLFKGSGGGSGSGSGSGSGYCCGNIGTNFKLLKTLIPDKSRNK